MLPLILAIQIAAASTDDVATPITSDTVSPKGDAVVDVARPVHTKPVIQEIAPCTEHCQDGVASVRIAPDQPQDIQLEDISPPGNGPGAQATPESEAAAARAADAAASAGDDSPDRIKSLKLGCAPQNCQAEDVAPAAPPPPEVQVRDAEICTRDCPAVIEAVPAPHHEAIRNAPSTQTQAPAANPR